tara:strand:+ start:17432 stop:18268 length:837 start_codon:yes stop_codon:yes gene_type:complete
MKIDSRQLEKEVIEVCGLSVDLNVSQSNEGTEIKLRPNSIESGKGFYLLCKIGWRSMNIDLVIERFGKNLLSSMEKSSLDQRLDFCSHLNVIQSNSNLHFRVNEEQYDQDIYKKWPSGWNSVQVKQKSGPLAEEEMNQSELTVRLFPHLMAVLSLLETKPIHYNLAEEGLPEGALERVAVNRYERSALNRKLCLKHYGAECRVCEFNFNNIFGKLGEGFIHVHHITPVSQLGDNYIINPIKDLIPLCPNCHAMIHKKNPPFTIEELKTIRHTTKVKRH